MTTKSPRLPVPCLFPQVYLEAVGPDPKGVKAESQVFCQSNDGELRTSASGVLWAAEGRTVFILGPASLARPFTRGQALKRVLGEANRLPKTRYSAAQGGKSCKLKLLGVVEVPGVADSVQSLCKGEGSWKWGWKLAESARPAAHLVNASLAIFASDVEALQSPARAAEMRQAPLPQQGSGLWCSGSPFGCLAPHHFQEYLATGCVASSPREGSSICLADIHCLPGMEGAPVLNSEGCFCGVLAAPLSSSKFDAEVGVVILAAAITSAVQAWRNDSIASPALRDVGRDPTKCAPHTHGHFEDRRSSGVEQLVPQTTGMPAEAAALRNSRDSVVAVTCGASWASGVVVNRRGVVLTVAHVLEPLSTPASDGATESRGCEGLHQQPEIQIGVSSHVDGLVWYSASVAYRFNGALDLAVLHADVPPDALRPAALCRLPAEVGQDVTLVGYGLFHPDRLGRPLVGEGVVSNVIRSRDGTRASRDVMLISSTAVHPGCSGGALFGSGSALLGIVTSNTRHAASGRSFARLNFSIAAASLEPIWRLLDGPKFGPAAFAALDEESEELRAVWTLREPPNVLGARRSEDALQRLSRLLEGSNVQLEQGTSKL